MSWTKKHLLDIADELGVNLVERDGFAGQHIRAVHAANGKRAKAERVARADQFLSLIHI